MMLVMMLMIMSCLYDDEGSGEDDVVDDLFS